MIEVGVGGRTDATNVIVGEANGVATIGYDHCNVLGSTLTDIAYEKSGIFKVKTHFLFALCSPTSSIYIQAGKPAISSPQSEEVTRKLAARAYELKAVCCVVLCCDVVVWTIVLEY